MTTRRITRIFAFFGVIGYCCYASLGAAATTPAKWVTGYYPLYERGLYPSNAIDFASLTHLVVGRVWPKSDGTLDISFDMDPISGPQAAVALTKKAHAAGKSTILMVGGAGTNLQGEWLGATSPARLGSFIANLLALANQLGFDGFDLDWEDGVIDYTQFLALAQQLRKTAPTKIITLPAGWINPNWQTVDPFFKKVVASLNQLNIMTYDMAGNWEGWWSWHLSALQGGKLTYPSSAESSVAAYLAAGIPAAKLGIGIPFYANCWSPPVTGPRQDLSQLNPGTITTDSNLTQAEVMNLYYSPANYRYDTLAQAPYLTSLIPMGPKQCAFVSYENELSVAAKGSFVKRKGLGGVIIWTIGQGYNVKSKTPNGLLQAVKKSLQ